MALTLITKILFVILRKYLPYVLNISRLKSILQSRLDFEGGNILLRKLWVCITTRLVLRSISNYIMFFKSFSYKKNYLDWPNEPDYTLSGPLKLFLKKLNWSKKGNFICIQTHCLHPWYVNLEVYSQNVL